MSFSPEFIKFVVYPIIVLIIGGVGSFLITRLVKYFNKLDSTLTELTKDIIVRFCIINLY